MIYAVDTHVWLWYLAGHPRLSAPARSVLQDGSSRFVLPATAYAEACWIVEHGRLEILSVQGIQTSLAADPRFSVYPLNQAVIDRSHALTTIREMHDRQIVATALILSDAGEEVALLTHDANITEASLVRVVW